MSLHRSSNVYREQLSSLNHGVALWDPKPINNLYDHISIGDVGYLQESGAFMRLFNVTLPWNDPSNSLLQVPEKYEHLELVYSTNVHSSETYQREHRSHVSKVDNNYANTHREAMGQMYECQAQTHGALLSLPHGGDSKDVVCTKEFERYIKDNVDSWFRWSRRRDFPIERMEDLILVTGCTLATSWAAAVFDNSKTPLTGSDSAAISLDVQNSNRGGAHFFWHNDRGNVDYRNSYFDPTVEGPLPRNQCVFFRGFRARRIFFRTRPMRAEAEPLPDDPDNRRDDEIQVTRIPDDSNEYQYRDPLVVILDYIEEKCQEDTIAKSIEDIVAIAHDDDLQLFKDIETITADAIENFLREKKMPLLIENGVAILPRFPVSDEDKAATFYAAGSSKGKSDPLYSEHAALSTHIDPSSPHLDKSAFVKYMKDSAREYRTQANQVIYICLSFARTQEQTRKSYDELRSVQQVVDDALYYTMEARKKTTVDADKKFEEAIRELSAYGQNRGGSTIVAQIMAEAEAKNKSSSKFLERLKERIRPLPVEEPTVEVEFLLHRSLLDKNPTIVKQVLSPGWNLSEVLWNFSRFKGKSHLSLRDNPHFYERLPTSAEEYDGQFQMDPIEIFYYSRHNSKIHVLTDDGCLGRVFLKTSKKSRAFGNVWVLNNTVIFKDICGKLEGENIIGSAIKYTPSLWYFEGSSLPNGSVSLSVTPMASTPIASATGIPTTETPMTSSTEALLGDWREPILRMLRSQDLEVNTRISNISPTGSSSSSPSTPFIQLSPTIGMSPLTSGFESLDFNAHSTSPIHPQIVNQSSKSMNIFDYWKPKKLEERGHNQVSEARKLLEAYSANLNPSDRHRVQGLLTLAEDLEGSLARKYQLSPLMRLKLARKFDKKAEKVLDTIKGLLDHEPGLGANTPFTDRLDTGLFLTQSASELEHSSPIAIVVTGSEE